MSSPKSKRAGSSLANRAVILRGIDGGGVRSKESAGFYQSALPSGPGPRVSTWRGTARGRLALQEVAEEACRGEGRGSANHLDR
jgi:hypothetical protein